MALHVTFNLYRRASGRVLKIDHKAVGRVVYETGSECGQIQCYTKSHTLIVLLLLAHVFITCWQSPTSVSSTVEYIRCGQ